MTKLKAWLATSRFANLPTIWSHVLAASLIPCLYAYYISASGGIMPERTPLEWENLAENAIAQKFHKIFILGFGASLLYLGGCLLGDFIDRHFDRKYRPERPIPQGILEPSPVFIVATSCLTIGTLIMLIPQALHFANWSNTTPAQALNRIWLLATNGHVNTYATASLTTCITCYAIFHKRLPILGLFLMSACRGLLIIAVATSFEKNMTFPSGITIFTRYIAPWAILYGLASAVYTTGIVLVARTESDDSRFKRNGLLVFFMLLLPLGLLTFSLSFSAIQFVCIAIFLFWMRLGFLRLKKNNKGDFVSRALAGFCLIDLIAIASTFSAARIVPAPSFPHAIDQSPFLLTALGLFLLALILQKFTPAT